MTYKNLQKSQASNLSNELIHTIIESFSFQHSRSILMH